MIDEEFYKQHTLPQAPVSEGVATLPKKIGPYPIESLLSKGGMSLLYLGKHPEQDIPLAIKVLSDEFVTHDEIKQQFLRESEIIAMTDHPNIIGLYGQGEWEGGLYIAMEFVQGISLRQFIKTQTLSLKSALNIILQVAYALLHLHSHGVIHRDLKPENILINEDGQVKVIDFGIALFAASGDEKTSVSSRLLGTPNYMSPEQKKNPLKVNHQTDIYSLGILAYELILGRFSYGSIQLELLPEGIREIITKAVQPNLSKRYDDIVDFITDINQYMKSGALEKHRTGHDQIRELLEKITTAHRDILPESPPNWNELDIGIGRPKNIYSLTSFYEFEMLPDRSIFVLFADIPEHEIESLPHLGYLKGISRALLHPFLSGERSFNLNEYTTALNRILAKDHFCPALALVTIHFQPENELFEAFSCGLGSLWHIPFGATKPRELTSFNDYIGKTEQMRFDLNSDNWREGDLLIVHSFNLNEESAVLEKSIADYIQLNPRKQAEALFRRLAMQKELNVESCPHALLVMQRIL